MADNGAGFPKKVTRLRYCYGRAFFTTHWNSARVYWAYVNDDLSLGDINTIETLNDEDNGAYVKHPQYDDPFFLDSLLGI